MNLVGKTCLITGANSGMGLAAAKQFARAGADVVMVCRDSSRGKAALMEVIKEIPDAKPELMVCDLSSVNSLRNFIDEFQKTHSSLNVLFNNAAVMKSQRTITSDGFETMFQTNYLAPVILIESLLDMMKQSLPARIINIAVPQDKLRVDFDDLQSSKQYKSFDAFMKTKLYLLLYTLELSKRLAGSGIVVNSVDPGMFKSGLGREFPWLLRKLMTLCAQTAEQAAEKIVFHASSDEVEGNSGKVFAGKEEKPLIPYWIDPNIRALLLTATERLIDSLKI